VLKVLGGGGGAMVLGGGGGMALGGAGIYCCILGRNNFDTALFNYYCHSSNLYFYY
jgi:hypothetical protein